MNTHFRTRQQPREHKVVLELDEGPLPLTVPLTVRRHPRARRIILRLAPEGDGAVVTIPEHASFDEGLNLARDHAAWIARRWHDPAFPIAFPWFDTRRYWDEHILALREQLALMAEPPLDWQP